MASASMSRARRSRFKLATEEVRWDDLVRGPQHIDAASDPVLVRADGSYLYSFTSVVDDIALDITHVIRGEDHAHLPLLVDAQGGGLSKRAGSLSIVGALAAPSVVRAQDKYPERTVRLVVPFAPAGPTDIIGRMIAEKMTAALGQTMIVENKAGGAGVIGANESRPPSPTATASCSRGRRPTPSCRRR